MTPEERRSVVAAFIHSYAKQYARPPTYREIRKGCGLSSTSVVAHTIYDLADRGMVTLIARGSRTVLAMPDEPEHADPIYKLAWDVVDAWDDGDLGDAIRAMQHYLERFAPRSR